MICICNSMPKSGSTWFSILIREILKASGFGDTPDIFAKYGLSSEINDYGSPGAITPENLSKILLPHRHGETYALKLHQGPNESLLQGMDQGIFKMVFVYRDPRDIAVSAYEYAALKRKTGAKLSPFYSLETYDQVVSLILGHVDIFFCWRDSKQVQMIRYEDLTVDTFGMIRKALDHFALGKQIDDSIVQSVIAQWSRDRLLASPDTADRDRIRLNRGVSGRFRSVDIDWTALNDSAHAMGYSLE